MKNYVIKIPLGPKNTKFNVIQLLPWLLLQPSFTVSKQKI